jgi:hypothetical protein
MTTSFDLEGDEWPHEIILPRYLSLKQINSVPSRYRLWEVMWLNKIKSQKYHTIGTVPQSNREVVERG